MRMKMRLATTTLLLLIALVLRAGPATADVLRASDGDGLDLFGVHLQVGDIVAIAIEEGITTTATHDQSTTDASKLEKTTNRGILGIFSALIPAKNGSRSTGSKNGQAMKLTMNVSARVTAVKGNTFDLEGRRDTTVNGQKMTVMLKASARRADLNSANILSSTKLCDVTLQIEGLPKKQSDDFLRSIFNWIL